MIEEDDNELVLNDNDATGGRLREDEGGSLASSRGPGGEERAAGPCEACVAGYPQHSQSPESSLHSLTSSASSESSEAAIPEDVMAESYCIKCCKQVPNLSRHMVRRHQKELNADEAHLYGFALCACGVFAKGIAQHWSQWCKLPLNDRRIISPSLQPAETVASQAVVEAISEWNSDPLTGIQLLFSVLKDDQASSDAIKEAFLVLAKLPAARKIWKPAEASLINECASRIAQSYTQYRRPVDLFRFLAIPKVALAGFIIRGRLGKLRKRLRAFPHLSDEFEFESALESFQAASSARSPPDIEKLVHSKLSKGLPGAAFKLLEDTLGIADASEETIEKLSELHPPEPQHLWPISGRDSPINISLLKVESVVKNVSRESSGGPSGIDGCFIHVLKHNEQFHAMMLSIAIDILNGRMILPDLLLASRLVPLVKNSQGDIRPIAIGEMLFRTACRIIMQSCEVDLLRSQFGVRSKNGVEPIIHLARIRCERESITSVDLKNAFNSMKRSFIIDAVESRAPGLANCFKWAYGRESSLFVDGEPKLLSKSGVKQGDPLAPLYFSLGYSKIVQKIELELENEGILREMPVLSYLDDTYLFTHQSQSDRALRVVKRVFREFESRSGLQLKEEKTWQTSPSEFRSNGVKLLGSAIGAKSEDFLVEQAAAFGSVCDKLSKLKAQDSLLLLRQCAIPKVTHWMRTMLAGQNVWERFDSSIRGVLLKHLRRFEVSALDDNLISLPMRCGGLGLTLPSAIYIGCYKASEAESFKMLESRARGIPLPNVDDFRNQRARSAVKFDAMELAIEERYSEYERRKFIDNGSHLGSMFLHTYPSEAISTFSDAEFSSALAYRLLIAIEVCRSCNKAVDGTHELGCEHNQSLRVKRHELVKKSFASAFSGSGLDVQLEAHARDNSGRRCDVLASGLAIGGAFAIDVTVTGINKVKPRVIGDGFAKARQEVNNVVAARVSKKVQENAGLNYGGAFLPIVFTVGGTVNEEVINLWKKWRKFTPRIVGRLKFTLSCILAKYRGLMWMKCKLAL